MRQWVPLVIVWAALAACAAGCAAEAAQPAAPQPPAADGGAIRWPVTAPQMCQTVVVASPGK